MQEPETATWSGDFEVRQQTQADPKQNLVFVQIIEKIILFIWRLENGFTKMWIVLGVIEKKKKTEKVGPLTSSWGLFWGLRAPTFFFHIQKIQSRCSGNSNVNISLFKLSFII